VLGPLRTLVSVAFLAVLVWGAFAIKLGDRTFADHMDRIGETEEAKALLEGARGRVRPALEEFKMRVIGEYVEAPTFVPAGEPAAPRRPPAVMRIRDEVAAAPAKASTAESGRLPGRRPLPGALADRGASAPARASGAGKSPGKREARPAGRPSGATKGSSAGKVPGKREAKPVGATKGASAGKVPGKR
jgi:hypothetical protein